MAMKYIRDVYGVPAKRGMRIKYRPDGAQGLVIHGEIVGSLGYYLRVRIDGHKHISNFHPTWNIEYIKSQ